MAVHFEDSFWEGNGFEEIHRHMKNGTELSKEFESVLSDRADLEKEYVKGLHKIAVRARKSTRRCVGSMEATWQKFLEFLEVEEEAHKNLSTSLSQDCCKTMKVFTEQQIKQREQVEQAVEKQHKAYIDKHRSQLKNKKVAFKLCRDLESSYDQLRDIKGGRSNKPTSDKDIHKLEKTCRKSEESLNRANREYFSSNIKTEETRLAWESAMYRCCRTMESLEIERLQQVQAMFNKYCDLVQSIIQPTEQSSADLMQVAGEIYPEGEIELACSTSGTGPNQPEQLLLDCYEEEFQNHMDPVRRSTSLDKKIQEIEDEIDRQQKAKAGVEQLARVYDDQPDFVDEKGKDDVERQLVEADAMLNMLKANHFKLLCAHSEISQAPCPSSHFRDYITTTSDKHGQPMSILKIPLESVSSIQSDYEAVSNRSPSKKSSLYPNGGAGTFDDDSEDAYPDQQQHDGALQFQEDEFDDQQDGEYEHVGKCEAIYEYAANEDDELTLKVGDVIHIIDKYDQDWWQGELNGTVGIFPASYVEET